MLAYIENKNFKDKMRPNRYIDKCKANYSAAPTGGRLRALLIAIKLASKVYTEIS